MWWEQVRLNSLLSCLHIKHKCTLWAPLEEHGWDSCMSAPFVQTSFWEFFLCHLKLPVLLPKAALSCHTQFLTKSCMFRQLWNPRCVWFHRCLHLFIPFLWLCDCLLTDLTCFFTCNNCSFTKRLVFLSKKGKLILSRTKTSIYCFIVSCTTGFGALLTMAWKILTWTVCCLWWAIKMNWGAY